MPLKGGPWRDASMKLFGLALGQVLDDHAISKKEAGLHMDYVTASARSIVRGNSTKSRRSRASVEQPKRNSVGKREVPPVGEVSQVPPAGEVPPADMAVVCATEAPTAEGGLTASGSAAVLTAEKQAHEAMRRERSERKDEAQVASRKKIAALNRQATARGTVYMVHPGASGREG